MLILYFNWSDYQEIRLMYSQLGFRCDFDVKLQSDFTIYFYKDTFLQLIMSIDVSGKRWMENDFTQ